jgi:hypothetical protein
MSSKPRTTRRLRITERKGEMPIVQGEGNRSANPVAEPPDHARSDAEEVVRHPHKLV